MSPRKSPAFATFRWKRWLRQRRPTSFACLGSPTMLIERLPRRGCRALRAALLAALLFAAAPAVLHAQALFERFNMAVAADRTDEVAALLARGMDPNTVDLNGDPALVVAARLGYEATLDALLRAGAKVNARNRFGDNAILVAA